MAESSGAGLAPFTASTDWFTAQLIAHLNPPDNWAHDRTAVVSGSEIGACERQVWDSKRNPQPWSGNGFTARGHSVEGWFADPSGVFERLQTTLAAEGHDVWFTATGPAQQTLIDDHNRISVTPDGFLYLDGETIYLEIKSIDPRVNLKGTPRAKHVAQCQYGMEITHRVGRSKPTRAFLIYINASDFQAVETFQIDRNETMAAELVKRAVRIHRAKKPSDLDAEGLAAGGAECATCRLKDYCKQEKLAQVSGLSDDAQSLPDDILSALDDMAQQRASAVSSETEPKPRKSG